MSFPVSTEVLTLTTALSPTLTSSALMTRTGSALTVTLVELSPVVFVELSTTVLVTLISAVLVIPSYLPSPEYVTVMLYSPSANSGMLTVALPFIRVSV